MARFAFFWPDNSSYLTAGLLELARRGHDVRLTVVREAAFDDGAARRAGVQIDLWGDGPPLDRQLAGADVVVVCGWHIPRFRAVARKFRGVGPRVVFFDTQWTNSMRQRARLPVARLVIPRLFDIAFVPGERQAQTARRLGFAEDDIRWGGLTFDEACFSQVSPLAATSTDRSAFLFAGRYAPEKGIDVLVQAYQRYRARSSSPFDLIMAGGVARLGEWELDGEGILHQGFVQPAVLAELMARASCFILPSVCEPYGVVLQEAAAAGLPLIATSACGASAEVLEPGWNGWLVGPGDVEGLARAMHAAELRKQEGLARMGARSRVASGSLVPERWADSLESCL